MRGAALFVFGFYGGQDGDVGGKVHGAQYTG